MKAFIAERAKEIGAVFGLSPDEWHFLNWGDPEVPYGLDAITVVIPQTDDDRLAKKHVD